MCAPGATNETRATTHVDFETFAKRWTSGELARDFPDHVKPKDHRTDLMWLKKYINPLLSDVPIDLISLQHCE